MYFYFDGNEGHYSATKHFSSTSNTEEHRYPLSTIFELADQGTNGGGPDRADKGHSLIGQSTVDSTGTIVHMSVGSMNAQLISIHIRITLSRKNQKM